MFRTGGAMVCVYVRWGHGLCPGRVGLLVVSSSDGVFVVVSRMGGIMGCV